MAKSQRNPFQKALDLFRKPSVRWGAGTLGVIGMVVGILFSAGFLTFVEATGTEQFCTSCHEMNAFVFEEYKQSAHYSSASGVRPECGDCHVPPQFIPKMGAKIRATFVEIPSHLMGTIDTREKFEAKREELAKRVWARLESNDSAPCRGCHNVNNMAMDEQALRARREHEEGFAKGETCISCHKGIAHSLPQSMLEEDAEEVDFNF
ncbi:MAG TPA: NapC/NirT family cytochrome c [Xanthomonadales bacterium]|nr:NapC/NirT family cytochrome c [Xanthomonadales bacterium]